MSRSKTCAIFLLTLFTFGVRVTPACSTTITTYSSLASWQAATTGDQTDNFEGLVPAGSYTSSSSPIFQNGVEFLGISGATGVADTSSGPFSWATFGTGEAGFVSGTTGLNITLPSPVTAFGINLWTFTPNGATTTVTTLSQPSTVPTSSTAPPTFFGVTSDTAFSTVSVSFPTTSYTFFDNFTWGTAQAGSMDPVPEASTLLMIGLAVLRRKRAPR
jgi:hypothetical protein